ncbi:MAG: phage baseplate assembly protein V [Gaiellaceae bacterium]
MGDSRLGVWRALVVEGRDPEGAGRVQVKLPAETGEGEAWARLAIWFHPEADDEVLIAFEGGDPRRPVVVGALWSSSETPPGSSTGRESAGGGIRGRLRRAEPPPRG